jgi:hypothetical protein
VRTTKTSLFYQTLLSAVITLASVFVGSYITYKYSVNLFLEQKKFELRVQGYSDLQGLKVPISQVEQTLLEASALSDFYNFRWLYLTKDKFDLNMALEENKRNLSLIPEFSKLQRDLFKTLANISVVYSKNPELTTAISELYNFKTIIVNPPNPDLIKTQAQLDKWHSEAGIQLRLLVKQEFTTRIEKIISVLEKENAGK